MPPVVDSFERQPMNGERLVTLFRQFIALVLAGALVAPTWGASSPVVGVSLNSQGASVRGGSLLTGSTIFSGDGISVDSKGDAKIALTGGSEIDVLPNSAAVLTRGQNATQMLVQRGSVSFRSEPNAAVEAVMADATIRAARGSSAVGVITMESPETAIVVADRNALEITTARDSRRFLVPEGQTARITLLTADSQQGGQGNGQNSPAPAGKGANFHWGGKWTIAIIAVGAGAAVLTTGLVLEHENHKQSSVVSPFQPN